ncbi:MAG: HD domain-containing protein [Nitrospinota bacterium]|nr:HD domain-containing protein [Nitrospinota bacterium]
MEKLKRYVFNHFESHFIFTILVSVILINFFVYSRIAFLNFYYLPIMLAGYYLGRRTAVLGAFFTVLMVCIFVLADLDHYYAQEEPFHLYFNLTVWAGFLILSGWIIGGLKEKLRFTDKLREELAQEKELLDIAHNRLSDYSSELESKVSERTRELERSQGTVESLKNRVEETLFSVMDSKVARLMIEGKLQNEKRQISVLFSDLKDFTLYSDQNPPEIVINELNSYLEEMENCITQFYGHIDKYIGDGIMVEFGAPVKYKNHPMLAVLAGLAMQERMIQIESKWKMRVGIATGLSVVGLLGSKRKSYSCIGDTANLAARLEELCEPGQVYIDHNTYMIVQQYFNTSRVRSVYGKREADKIVEAEIRSLESLLNQNPNDLEMLYALGQAFFKKRAASAAMEVYQKILKLDPNHVPAREGYQEAVQNRDEYEKVAIRGKKERVAIYRVTGVKDPLMDRNKIPRYVYDQYGAQASHIKFPVELIHASEAIEGTLGHSKVVAILSYAIADKMGLSFREKEELLKAGYLHDLGKMIIPHEIRGVNRPLSKHEQKLVHQHPMESTRMIKQLGYDSEILLKYVRSHHERFDGSGYPQGLKGDAIPVGARILSLANDYDQLTSRRKGKEGLSYQNAIQELQKKTRAGKHDPQCFSALTQVFNIQTTPSWLPTFR